MTKKKAPAGVPPPTATEKEKLAEILRLMSGVLSPGMGLLPGTDPDLLAAMTAAAKPKRSATTRYFDRDGNEVDRLAWSKLTNSRDLIYQNDKIRIQVIWHGVWDNCNVVPLDQAKLCEVKVSDRIFRADAVTCIEREAFTESPDSKWFATAEKAGEYYRHLVAKWTESYLKEDGTLKEVGNELAPPDPDKPSALSAPAEDVW